MESLIDEAVRLKLKSLPIVTHKELTDTKFLESVKSEALNALRDSYGPSTEEVHVKYLKRLEQELKIIITLVKASREVIQVWSKILYKYTKEIQLYNLISGGPLEDEFKLPDADNVDSDSIHKWVTELSDQQLATVAHLVAYL